MRHRGSCVWLVLCITVIVPCFAAGVDAGTQVIVSDSFDDGVIDASQWTSDGKWKESKGSVYNTARKARIESKETGFSKRFAADLVMMFSGKARLTVRSGDIDATSHGPITCAEIVVDSKTGKVVFNWYENGIRKGSASKNKVKLGKKVAMRIAADGTQVTLSIGSLVLVHPIGATATLTKGRIQLYAGKGTSKCDSVQATCEVDASDPPVANADGISTSANTAVTFSPLANDTGVGLALDGIASSPDHGSAVANADDTVTYTPVNGYVGPDHFRYRIRDAESREAEGEVNAEIASGPPTAFFGLGLANSPGDLSWMTSSGVPWNYRYQYLAGGVNTGSGWSTWNSPAGQFATYYVNNSDAAGYAPVFTYYQIVHSSPNPGNENPDPKLTNASTMNAYYADWKLLMQKCGAFGKPVIVHVEPDLWAYMQLNHGDNPANTSVSVSSSGFSEAAGFANNAAGFAQALASIRNTYATNVTLAWHASAWATGIDLILNNGDPVVLGNRLASFFTALNANFGLIFFDPSDRDAGFYQYIYGDGGAHWWDNADFVSFRQYIQTITGATGRKAMLWQVPIGNTLYRSCDNTWDHYQDNRPQYFLQTGNRQNIVDYANAGVIAILFGRGADGPTDYTDDHGDGITNPAPINGNNLAALYADDDGGFLRIGVAAYYAAGPVPLP
ncbi:MAG: Ig-like domain-containing protein [Acidobacteria bacterium]|nr:Ig-like domain-containing protein [Acidobacteriota bacterium]